MKPLRSLLGIFLLLAVGCASLEGKKIQSKPEDDKAEDGLSYYLVKPVFTVEVKDKHENKSAEPVYDLKVGFVPDLSERYEVRLKNGLVSNDSLSLKMLDDGRLVSINSKSDSQVPEVIKSLGNLAGSVVALAALAEADTSKILNKAACEKKLTPEEYAITVCVFEQVVKKQKDTTCSFNLACESPLPLPPSLVVPLNEKNLDTASASVQKLIALREKPIVDSFEKGGFANEKEAPASEKKSLEAYEEILKLEAFQAAIAAARPAGPRQQIAKHLKEKKEEAERQYLRYVKGEIDERTFKEAVAGYSQSVDRFLQFDDRFDETDLDTRQTKLAGFLSREIPAPPGPTDKQSKAFVDYRSELDRVINEMSSRVGGLAAEKKTEPLPLGTQVTRKLEDVITCTLCRGDQIFSEEQRLLKLADLWIKYGKKDAVVFQVSESGASKVECDKFFNSSGGQKTCSQGGAQ
ncbi:MAG TPA: hypothetical protein VKM72_17190 [Thermoanaerobaculia bacterium]|nr:hypothetical protein [Thermoanaerobaculia bacterium]